MLADVPGRTPGGLRTLSVASASRSVVEALDEIVRAHGALEWVVRYCEPRVDPEVVWLGVFTYDDDGVQAPVVQRRDQTGRRLPPRCQP